MTDKQQDQRRLNVILPADVHRKFQIYCINHGSDISTVIRDFITKLIKETKRSQ